MESKPTHTNTLEQALSNFLGGLLAKKPTQLSQMRDLAKAMAKANAEHALLNHLDRLRSTDSALFAKTIFNLMAAVGERSKSVTNRYELTPQENAFLAYELMIHKDWTVEQTVENLNLSPKELIAEPTGDELLAAAIAQIRLENPQWKPSQVIRFVTGRIKRQFAKNPKPFTKEDVTVGAKWYANKIKFLKDQREQRGQRQRPRVNVREEEWRELFHLRFGTPTPEFARKYQKAVRDEHRIQAKRESGHRWTK